MSIDEDVAGVVAAFQEAWGDHDLDAAVGMLTDDCLFEATGPAPDGARHVGPDALCEAWRPIFEDPNSSFETEEMIGVGDRVVVRWCYRWAGGHVRGVDLLRVDGSRIAEKLSYVKG